MVKTFGVVISTIILFAGCGFDFMGISISNDLDERLKERNNFALLDDMGWRHALKDLDDEYSFLVVTDIHINDGKTNGFEKMKSVIDDPSNNIKFMVVLGDVTQWSARKDLELYLDIIKGFGLPVYTLIGNHDVYFGRWSNWKELVGSTSYRIDAGATTLFMMDNANLYFGKQQMDWLEDELKRAAPRVFVFAHVNFFMQSPMGAQHHDVTERARVAAILKGKCEAVFMGHKHVGTEIHEAGGVKYITVDSFDHEGYYYIVNVSGDKVTYSHGTL